MSELLTFTKSEIVDGYRFEVTITATRKLPEDPRTDLSNYDIQAVVDTDKHALKIVGVYKGETRPGP